MNGRDSCNAIYETSSRSRTLLIEKDSAAPRFCRSIDAEWPLAKHSRPHIRPLVVTTIIPPMRTRPYLAAFFAVALFSASAAPQPDQFTPLVVAPLTANTRSFHGTDGKTHLTYELVLTNTNPTPATLQRVVIVDASDQSKALASFDGRRLLSHLRTTGATAADSPTIEFNQTRLLLIDFTLDPLATIPARVLHNLQVLAAPAPSLRPATPVALSYTVAPLDINPNLPQIGPPLSGGGWVAINGCCEQTLAHRVSSLGCNGGIYFAQRFAIDWMRLDKAGRLLTGDPADVHSYPDYGADVLAVAEGTVVGMLDALDDQKPGSLPDRNTITIENVDGNHLVIDLGDGVFAFYAHLRHGSIKVAVGDRVHRGQVLASLGNTGNTSAPHLHFQLMESPSVLCSNGLPYSFDSFALAGQIPLADYANATGMEGNWNKGMFPAPVSRKGQYPLDLNIVDFSSAK